MVPKQHVLSFEDWTTVSRKANFVEFDWVGIDKHGHIGVFSSVSVGYIPSKVFSSYEKYLHLDSFLFSLPKITAADIVTKVSGILDFWIDLAQKGFYAYDNQDLHRDERFDRYDLIARPSQALLARSISNLAEFDGIIPRFNLEFSGDVSFSQLQVMEILT